MKLLSPTPHRRLNELTGLLLLSLGLVTLLSLVSYYAQDPSWDTAAEARPLNLMGYPGSYLSDLLFQSFGAAAFLFPLLAFRSVLRPGSFMGHRGGSPPPQSDGLSRIVPVRSALPVVWRGSVSLPLVGIPIGTTPRILHGTPRRKPAPSI